MKIKKLPDYAGVALIGVLVVLATPFLAAYGPVENRDNLETVSVIRSLGIEEEVTLLEADGVYTAYLDSNFHRRGPYDKQTNFFAFIERENINMIVVSDNLRNAAEFRTDEEWQWFQDHYRELGWRQKDTPVSNTELFLKEELEET